MKKQIIILFLILSYQCIKAQNIKEIDLNLENNTLKESINIIESNSDYKFYFIDEWLLSSDEIFTKTYKNSSIEDILNDIFKNTNLNFYLDKNKIILTKNSIVYEKIPDLEIIEKTIEEIEPKSVSPIFNKQYTNPNHSNGKILMVGKETKNKKDNYFILNGIIKNAKSNEPIANIVIRTVDKTSNAVTDFEGKYVIKLKAGLNNIETKAVNYTSEEFKIMMYNNGKLDISLNESINFLNEIVLTGKEKEVLNTTTTGVTTITSEEIKSVPMVLGERDILKVATIIPGIKNVGEGSSGFNVRGGKEDQNLFLLDDVVLYNPAHFFGFFSSINAYTIKSADIYKGSIPSQFGGKLSSVFDISTKKGSIEKFTGEGGIGPVTSNLTFSTPVVKNKSSLLVGARATYSGWILRSLKKSELQNSKASFYDAIVKYNHKINEKNELETTLYYSDDEFNISTDSLNHYTNSLATIKWKHKVNDNTNYVLNLSNSQYKFNIDYQNGTVNSFDYGYKLNDSQIQLKFNSNFRKKHLFQYGISSKLYTLDPGNIIGTDPNTIITPKKLEREKGLESGLYFTDVFTVNEKLALNFGARFSIFNALGERSQNIYENGLPKNNATLLETKYFKNNDFIKTYVGFEPRISAKYSLTQSLSIKGSYDKTYQYLHLLSSNTTQSPLDRWKMSDLNVKPQLANQFSLGLYKNLKENIYQVSVEGYYKRLKNILDYKVGAELVLNENVETELLQGEGKAYGIEFLIKKQVGKFNGWIGYTYSRTFIKLDGNFNEERVNNGNYFAANYDKPHDFSAIINYKLTKRFSFSGNFVYQTGRPITYPVGTFNYGNSTYTLYSDRNKFRIPDYYRMDLGFNIEGNHKLKKLAHSFWNISVYNVLGRNNPYSIFFITDDGKIKAYKTSIFAYPIPTITYNFKF
jgi:hypothetical protein